MSASKSAIRQVSFGHFKLVSHRLMTSLDGAKLTKSVIRYLLDVYHLPKLLVKVQLKCSHMLALVINATSAKPKFAATENEDEAKQK